MARLDTELADCSVSLSEAGAAAVPALSCLHRAFANISAGDQHGVLLNGCWGQNSSQCCVSQTLALLADCATYKLPAKAHQPAMCVAVCAFSAEDWCSQRIECGLFDRVQLAAAGLEAAACLSSVPSSGVVVAAGADREHDGRTQVETQVHVHDNVSMDAALAAICALGDVAHLRQLLALAERHAVQLPFSADAGERAFIQACRDGRVEIVEELLAISGAGEINANAAGDAAFKYACEHGHMDIVKLLLALKGDRAVDVHVNFGLPLRLAISRQHESLVRLLLDLKGFRRLNINAGLERAFKIACGTGHEGIVRMLLEEQGDRRVDVHKREEMGFRTACAGNHVSVVHLLLELQGDRRVDVSAADHAAFIQVARTGHLQVLRTLLSLQGERAVSAKAYCRALAEALHTPDDLPQMTAVELLLRMGVDNCKHCSIVELLPDTQSLLDAAAAFSNMHKCRNNAGRPACASPCAQGTAKHIEPTDLTSEPEDSQASAPSTASVCFPLRMHATQQVLLHATRHSTADIARQSVHDPSSCSSIEVSASREGHTGTYRDWQACFGVRHSVKTRIWGLLACMPAAECGTELHQLLCSTAAPVRRGRTNAVVLSVCELVRNAVWHGISIPVSAVLSRSATDPRGVLSAAPQCPGLSFALQRCGRKHMILHRVAARLARQCS